MRCLKCGEIFINKIGALDLNSKTLGDYTVYNVEYEMCEKCGELLYSPLTLRAIEKVEEERKNQLLLQKPLGDFISATEVGNILGCTRQAVHKHKRIRRGFIHFVKYNGTYHYHKESVDLYKETGDGRFHLSEPKKAYGFNIPKKPETTPVQMETDTSGGCLDESPIYEPQEKKKESIFEEAA